MRACATDLLPSQSDLRTKSATQKARILQKGMNFARAQQKRLRSHMVDRENYFWVSCVLVATIFRYHLISPRDTDLLAIGVKLSLVRFDYLKYKRQKWLRYSERECMPLFYGREISIDKSCRNVIYV